MLFFTIALLEVMIWAETDIFVPSFPQLQDRFGLSPFMVELTIGVNLAAYCVCSLLMGGLGDKYGSRRVILSSVIIFMFGSVFCVFADSFACLLFGRLLQGIGSSGPAVMAYTVILEHFPSNQQKKLIAIVNGIVTISMAVAPVVGSFISYYYNWQGSFVALFMMSVFCLLLSYIYIPKDATDHEVSLSFKEYGRLLNSSKTQLYILTLSMLSQPYSVFAALSPLLFINNLQVKLEDFGFYLGGLSVLFAFISFASDFCYKRFGEQNCYQYSLKLMWIYVIGVALLMLFGVNDPLLITLVTSLMSAAAVFPINLLWPVAVSSMPRAKGKILALFVAARLILSSVIIQVVSYFYDGRYFYIGFFIILATLTILFCCGKLEKVDNINDKLSKI